MENFFGFKNEKSCLSRLGAMAHRNDGPYCRGVWDTVLCWPAAKADTVVSLPCPPLPGLLKDKKATRYCGPGGLWEDKEGHFTNGTGFTHYKNCYSREAWEYYVKYMSNKTTEERELIKDIIATCRTIEIVGLCISLIATIISLIIFCYFRSLKCHRTRIHKNLFVAMVVQISVRIILYVDQLVARESGGQVAGAASGNSHTIYDTPVFCEVLYGFLECTKTVKFMWMFIEGIYLHHMIAVSVFAGKPNYIVFYAIGWGFPMLLTTAWVIPMSKVYHETKCWFGYYMNPLIWIIEGPRAAVMAVNLLFLLNIIRVLVMKLSDTQTNETNKLRKAVKAAIVLLPLLGLTNFVIMLEPGGGNPIKLCVYSLFTSFLTASEGFFISLLYCFLNGEVRQTCRRHWERYKQRRPVTDLGFHQIGQSHSSLTTSTQVPVSSTSQTTRSCSSMSNGHVRGTRSGSVFKEQPWRRQTDQDLCPMTTSKFPDLPDLITCRTELMREDIV